MCGSAGYCEAAKLFLENRQVCKEHLPAFYIDQFIKKADPYEETASALKRLASFAREDDKTVFRIEAANGEDIIAVRLGYGGVYAGLWRLGKELDCGLNTDVLKVPVYQETVEIMELMNSDPYEADSAGSFILAVPESVPEDTNNLFEVILLAIKAIKRSEEIAHGLEKIPAFYIGHTSASKARTMKMPAGYRFLTPPGRQSKDMAAKKADRPS